MKKLILMTVVLLTGCCSLCVTDCKIAPPEKPKLQRELLTSCPARQNIAASAIQPAELLKVRASDVQQHDDCMKRQKLLADAVRPFFDLY